jgi:hypothetical protein
MQGQLTQPTELPTRNSGIVSSYKSTNTSTSDEHKGLSPTRLSPPTSIGSPAHSMPNYSPRSMTTNTGPAPFFETRMGSPVYQHPAHQSLTPQEHFPPPPVRRDTVSGSTLGRPHPVHGRSHELPASKSPLLVHGNVGEMLGEDTESGSCSTQSFT